MLQRVRANQTHCQTVARQVQAFAPHSPKALLCRLYVIVLLFARLVVLIYFDTEISVFENREAVLAAVGAGRCQHLHDVQLVVQRVHHFDIEIRRFKHLVVSIGLFFLSE